MSDNKKYLGDGVYADFDGCNITLTTEDGISTTNRIVLEPEVREALKRYEDAIEGDIAFRAQGTCGG